MGWTRRCHGVVRVLGVRDVHYVTRPACHGQLLFHVAWYRASERDSVGSVCRVTQQNLGHVRCRVHDGLDALAGFLGRHRDWILLRMRVSHVRVVDTSVDREAPVRRTGKFQRVIRTPHARVTLMFPLHAHNGFPRRG